MTREEILTKIKKCMDLSSSSNEHEAALAMQRAQEMMARYDISAMDIELSKVAEQNAKAHDSQKPPAHIARLVDMVARAFGCQHIFSQRWRKGRICLDVKFFGLGANAEIAAYAFEVLARQMERGRKTYLRTISKRMKCSSRSSLAAAWARGWVMAVSIKVADMAVGEKEGDSIRACILSHYQIEPVTVRGKKISSQKGLDAYCQGAYAGKNVHLHQAVNEQRRSLIE